jgi:hypothetical protein
MLLNKNGVFHYPKKDNRRVTVEFKKGIKITIPEKGQKCNGEIKKAVAQRLHSMTVGDAVHLYDKYGVIIEAV